MNTQVREIAVKEVSKEEMDKIIRYHVWGAIGVGLVPLPLLDFVALTGIQLNMLRKIAKIYKVPFFKDKVKNIISSLVGGALPATVSLPLSASIAKIIPIAGQTIGVMTMPIIAGATTYALAKVFVQHFASGGTFLTFDPEKVRAYYAEMLKEGEKVTADIKTGKEKTDEKVTPDTKAGKEKTDEKVTPDTKAGKEKTEGKEEKGSEPASKDKGKHGEKDEKDKKDKKK